jgi:molybdopterin synthase catalytic subunit
MEVSIEFTTGAIVIPAGQRTIRETGADLEFRGIVRETEQGIPIAGLTYEAHVPMAGRQLRRIIEELRITSPCQSLYFIHRLGWVPVGEASLYIRVQASHRAPAFQFCMALIDRVKQDVPIWKLNSPPPPSAAAP